MTQTATFQRTSRRLFQRLSQRCYWSYKFHGMTATLVGALAGLTKPVAPALPFRKWCRRFKDRSFDFRFQVDTANCVSPEDLEMAPSRRVHAVEYAATSPISFCQVISELGIQYSDYAFVDLGSGKGRVLLLASEFPFREVIGVEIAPSLHAIAEQNIATFQARTRSHRPVSSICSDVTNFVPPAGPTIFFFYNPFHGEVLECALENLRKSYEQSPRPMMIVYHNPVHRAVFERMPYLTAVESDDDAWALYTFGSTTTGS